MWDPAERARRRLESPERPPLDAGMGSAELEALVSGIVQVTLDTRLTEWDDGRRAALGAELRARLLAIFGQAPAVALGAPDADALAEPADEDVAEDAVALDAMPLDEPEVAVVPAPPVEVEPGPVSPSSRRLAELLLPRLAELGNPALAREDLRALLIRLAQRAFEDLPADGPAPDADRLGRLDVLQRRAAKLERRLKDARSALAYVSGLEHVDTGLASIYRAVQGLSPDDPNRESKKASLERIFQANLELQKRVEGGRPS